MKRTKRRKPKKNISVGLVAVCLCLAGVMALLLTPLFNVDNIIVRENVVLSEEAVVKSSGVAKGTNIFGISLSKVRDNVEKLPTVESAKVKRIFPSTISITVKESTPAAYIYDHGDCVGITADGRVTDVKHTSAIVEDAEPEKTDDKAKAADSEDGEIRPDSDKEEDESDEKEGGGEGETNTKSDSRDTGLERPLIIGMGEFSYKVGGKIEFSDETKSENLYKLLNEFLGDEICADAATVDMSRYEKITFTMKSGLNVNLGEAAKLSYKLKCFKAIMAQELDGASKGTLDLENLTYSPKNK